MDLGYIIMCSVLKVRRESVLISNIHLLTACYTSDVVLSALHVLFYSSSHRGHGIDTNNLFILYITWLSLISYCKLLVTQLE